MAVCSGLEKLYLPFWGMLCPGSWGITTSCSSSPAWLPPAGLFQTDLGRNQDQRSSGGRCGSWHRCLGGECLSTAGLPPPCACRWGWDQPWGGSGGWCSSMDHLQLQATEPCPLGTSSPPALAHWGWWAVTQTCVGEGEGRCTFKGADLHLAAPRSRPWQFPCTCTVGWMRSDPPRQEDDLPPPHAGVHLWCVMLPGTPSLPGSDALLCTVIYSCILIY